MCIIFDQNNLVSNSPWPLRPRSVQCQTSVSSTGARRRDELFAYIGGTAKGHKATILQSGGIEDHIYLLARIHPSFAISNTVKLLKANSSKWINDQRKIDAKFQWQRGYGAFSVSQSLAERVKRYIAHQREHHEKQSFRDEYLELLRRHKIDFDARYVFDEEVVS